MEELALGAMSIDKDQIRACLFDGCEEIVEKHSTFNLETSEFWKNYVELKRQSTDSLISVWNENKKDKLVVEHKNYWIEQKLAIMIHLPNK